MKRLVWLSIVLCMVSLISLIFLITPKSLFAALPLRSEAEGGSTIRFLYDGDGNRVAKIVNDKVTIYGGGVEKDLTSGKVTKYYSIKGNSVAVKKDSEISYLVRNHANSTSMMLGSSGEVTSRSSYYPYGSTRQRSGPIASRQYIGQLNDEDIGLYALGQRSYNPKTGSFIQADQMGSGLNKYVYSGGNPVTFMDDSGMDPVDTLARLLCGASGTSGCNNYDPGIWGRGAVVNGEFRSGAAQRALDMAESIHASILNGDINPKGAASRPITESEVKQVSEAYVKTFSQWWFPDYYYVFLGLTRAKVTNVNMAFVLAVAGQETTWQAPCGGKGQMGCAGNNLNAHLGEFFMSSSDILASGLSMGQIDPGAFHNKVTLNIGRDFEAMLYSYRASLGMSNEAIANAYAGNPEITYSLISGGNINFNTAVFYTGMQSAWVPTVGNYYNVFAQFAQIEPGYSWLLDDLTQYSPPSNPYSPYGPM